MPEFAIGAPGGAAVLRHEGTRAPAVLRHQQPRGRRSVPGPGVAAGLTTSPVLEDPPPAPAVLQVLPALVTGGVERGTLEIAAALVGAGFRALVASAGGPLVPALERLGARHVVLPLDRKSPPALWRNARALA